ncbi:DUF2335 domain-containing protein [Rickettsiales endosymbiont of Peranema trichophorum]|uniref:DUF2335 domain-containing protein n=1 Tax=Rickettsiales endosymbiont of Peranema trichophorum TaxID=2486577 RepID=UPI00102324B5|nr:DUF2335 domain-containing protein [Rickettsiales endosymbiont of Peranema trichophorum]RZI46024.1 DUF2335 domain-containing protein [Rickettsiales endosymbiont of Peranema trichophorum]
MKKTNHPKQYGYASYIQDRKVQHEHNSILPPPAILESYEEVSPGTVEKLLDLATIEQKHRHLLQTRSLYLASWTARLGQLCGVAISFGVLYTSYALVLRSEALIGGLVVLSGFCFLSITALLSHRTRGAKRGGGKFHHKGAHKGGQKHHHQER